MNEPSFSLKIEEIFSKVIKMGNFSAKLPFFRVLRKMRLRFAPIGSLVKNGCG